MAISLVVVSATPRATNRVSAARSTRALVSSAFPIASVYEAPLICGRLKPQPRAAASSRKGRLELVGLEQLLGLGLLDALVQALSLVTVAQHLGQREGRAGQQQRRHGEVGTNPVLARH